MDNHTAAVAHPSPAVGHPVAAAVTHCLERCDARSARAALERAVRTGTPVHNLVPAYECCLAAFKPSAEHEDLLRTVRHQIRDELVRLPLSARHVWIIPSDRSALTATAAHIASLREVSRGRTPRVWLWETAPSTGECIVIGPTAETQDPIAREHPEAASAAVV